MLLKTFLISYNRKSFLEKQINALRPLLDKLQIIIIDNGSNQAELLDYYSEIRKEATIIRLKSNWGYLVAWNQGIISNYCGEHDEPFILSDCDVVPPDNDWLDVLYHGLVKYPEVSKSAIGLKTDDIPDLYPRKNEVLMQEQEMKKLIPGDDLYCYASTDTTLALYRSGINNHSFKRNDSIRTMGEYEARHLTWYITDPDQETLQYYRSILPGNGHWRIKQENPL
jgi:glycosyltransferase involved in cell wall biosynthesis